MESDRPQKISIDHDDYHAEHIGRTKKGEQFFLTTPFEPAINEKEGCEYITLFKFDNEGNLLEHIIDEIGTRGSYDENERKEKYLARLNELGEVKYCRIEVKPFSVERNGVVFGLITREPEDKEDVWAVELLPGNYMAFFEPWDSGEYDT
ncbi:hypothetical protein BAZOLSSOX_1922 [uncultured Gammaproteobacteria bacterium]|jgi:hypothetical protein|nr:hypothetical protein [uncultured Gammaproteobacteria bacterium]VVH60748.1 hypothetical protein BAZOLSSOX_1922 [uncultured Gammaproteobacteria bacterium]